MAAIRAYNLADTDALLAIWRSASAIAHPFLPAEFIEQEAINLRDRYLPHAQTWVLEERSDGDSDSDSENDSPIGFIAMIETEIGGLFLEPTYHGRGLGKSMVDYVVSKGGVDKAALTVEVFEKNSIGRQFYDRYGFKEIGRYTHKGSGELTLQLAFSTQNLTLSA